MNEPKPTLPEVVALDTASIAENVAQIRKDVQRMSTTVTVAAVLVLIVAALVVVAMMRGDL